ncbi:MAG: hypothetical protein ACXVPN_12895 [Bacteroidia bacterium]
MKKISSLLLCLVLLLGACKKKDNSTTSGGGPTSSNGSGFTNISGTLMSEQNITYYKSVSFLDTTYSAMSWFFNIPQNNWIFGSINTTTYGGTVNLNSTRLKYYGSIPGLVFYIDTTSALNLIYNNSWQVSGANGIPAFSYAATTGWGIYNGYSSLPDTIHRTQDNIIILNNISGADSVCVNINDGSGTSGHSYTTAKVGPTTTSITIPMAKVTGLNNTANGTLTISLFKFAPLQTFGGKKFIFVKDLEFKKIVEIDNY